MLKSEPAQASKVRSAPQRRATEGPTAVISRRAAERLRAGHVWVYSSDVAQIIADKDGVESPDLYTVVDDRGLPLGTALYSPTSQIALRLVSPRVIQVRAAWLDLLRTRLESAIAMRREMLYAERGRTDASRLVFSEADALPGLIIDKYGDLVILQLLTQGMDCEDNREVIVDVLRRLIDPGAIIERPDPRIREIEQLSEPSREPLYRRIDAAGPALSSIFQLNGLRFHYDANSGQKTGAFLDQRENYAAAARYGHGDALDVCTYHGGFALHLAQVCAKVTGVDASRPALEVAESNLELNREALGGKSGSEVDWVEANAFDLLRDWSTSGPAYDTVVLDPPAFAKSKKAVEGALRGYKEMNLRALKLLRPGGTLITCSCSQQISSDDFTAVVAAAAGDAGRRLRLIERRGAAPDHPVILTIPETDYLKCLICSVE
ncbi:MAG TPA: class I SAM-dependent rRNA methyltransferase [Acidisarcina sp.]